MKRTASQSCRVLPVRVAIAFAITLSAAACGAEPTVSRRPEQAIASAPAARAGPHAQVARPHLWRDTARRSADVDLSVLRLGRSRAVVDLEGIPGLAEGRSHLRHSLRDALEPVRQSVGG